MSEISPQIILLLGPKELKAKYIEWCESVYGVNFKVLNKEILMSGNNDIAETSPAYLKDFAVLRRTLFSGDCVEELTNKTKKVFVLEDFLVNVEQLKAFETSVARVKKVVYLGSDSLSTELSEIA